MPVYLYSEEAPNGRKFENKWGANEIEEALATGWMEAPVWQEYLAKKKEEPLKPWQKAQLARKAKREKLAMEVNK